MKSKFLFLLFMPVFCFSQSQILKGTVETTSMLEGILVVNLSKEIQTETDSFGKFSIYADVGDLLVFSAVFIDKKRFIVEEEHFKKENIIPLEAKEIEIETVEINAYSHINAESLGIVPKGQKRYTQAERKLYTAQTEQHLGALINWITGKTKMLKILNEMDKEDKRVNYLSDLFNEDFFTGELKIESHNVMEFKYFALYFIEKELGKNQKNSYLKSLSKEEIEILLIPLAEEYLSLKKEVISDEK